MTDRTIENGGIFSDAVKTAVWERDGGRCQWIGCGIALVGGVNCHYDHIYPWWKGYAQGIDPARLGSLDNCLLLCDAHNRLKGDKVVPGAYENLGLTHCGTCGQPLPKPKTPTRTVDNRAPLPGGYAETTFRSKMARQREEAERWAKNIRLL